MALCLSVSHYNSVNLIKFQSLDLWFHLLSDQQLRLLHDGLTERVHPAGHQCGQEKGKPIIFGLIRFLAFSLGHSAAAVSQVREDEGAPGHSLHLDHQRRPGLPGRDLLQGGPNKTVRSYLTIPSLPFAVFQFFNVSH